ncbi:MAG: hypothetical protein IID31_02325 [Planctomycetes bacterium]|nr:hypothetical protein [Planctomycetota bacterium]
MRGSSVLVVAMSGAFAGAASGQLAPPPPTQSPREDLKYVEPSVRPPVQQSPAGRPQPGGDHEGHDHQAPAPQPAGGDHAGHAHQGPSRAPQAAAIPDLPFVPLVRQDADGREIPIVGLIAIAALKHNPLVGAETIEAARPIVVEWVDRLDLMVIDNIDMVLEVEAGFFQTLDFAVQEGVMAAGVYRNALMPKPSLLDQYLFSKGVLTTAQRSFNAKLLGGYVRAKTISISADVEAAWVERITAENGGVPRDMTPEETAEMRTEFAGKGFAFTFWYLCADSVWSMKRQLAFASGHMDEILEELDLDDAQRVRFKRTQAALGLATDTDERTRLMVDLIAPWDFDSQEVLLLTALDIRGPLETLPELDDAANKPDGLPPREDLREWKPGDPIAARDDAGSDQAADGGG